MDRKLKKLLSVLLCVPMFGTNVDAARRRFVTTYRRGAVVGHVKSRGSRNLRVRNPGLNKSFGSGRRGLRKAFRNKLKREESHKVVVNEKVGSAKVLIQNLVSYLGESNVDLLLKSLNISSFGVLMLVCGYVASMLSYGSDICRDDLIRHLIFQREDKTFSLDECLSILRYGYIDIAKTWKTNYSVSAAGLRRLWDSFVSAPERERRAFRRMNRSSKGACWDLALKVDYVARKFGFRYHYLLAYRITSAHGLSVPHTFNLVSLDGEEWYIYDPLADNGVALKDLNSLCNFIYQNRVVTMPNDYLGNLVVKYILNGMKDVEKKSDAEDLRKKGALKIYKGDSDVEKADKYYKHEFANHGVLNKGNTHSGDFEWYIMEQVNDDEKRKLSRMKWGKFLPEGDDERSFAYWSDSKSSGESRFGTNKEIIVRGPEKAVMDGECPFTIFG